MNQSELEANKCNRRQSPENACDQVTIGFGFASHCLGRESGGNFANQSQGIEKQNQSKREITFYTQLKTALK